MKNTLFAIGEAPIDFIPSETGCDFGNVKSFSPKVGGAFNGSFLYNLYRNGYERDTLDTISAKLDRTVKKRRYYHL